MALRRKGGTGYSLVELLVVLGIIAVITSVSIPVIARMGLFTSNKAQLAARELFTVLRAAKIYATTYNVETAVAYGGLLVEDSREEVGKVPVVDSVAVVRRLKRDELLLHNFRGSDVIFVPLRARDGGFKFLPNGTCVLPDLFEYAPGQSGGRESLRGLNAVLLWDIDNALPIEPRLDYDLNGDSEGTQNIFPAHVFSPEGGLIAPEGRQRLTFRVGILPDAESGDRFFRDESEGVRHEVEIFFDRPITLTILKDPEDIQDVNDPKQVRDAISIDIDIDIFLYVATGRVKVGS